MNDKEIELYKDILGMNDEMLLINEINEKHEKYLSAKLEEYEISYTQFKTIMAIAENSNISQKDLSALFDINESTVTRLIAKIEDKKIIKTTKNPNNKRRKEIKLTKKGKDLLSEIQLYESKWNKNFTSNLKKDEIKELNRLLNKAKTHRTRKTIFGTNYQIKRVEE